MAKFDVFKHSDGQRYLLEVQSDLLDHFDTRVIVPLLQLERAPIPSKRLNPIFIVEGKELSMVTQFITSVPKTMLKTPVANLKDEFSQITQALDMVFQGF